MKLTDALHAATNRLKAASIHNPQLDTRWLFEHALGLNWAQLLSQSERLLTDDEIHKIDRLIARREQHESVARIIGNREFWGLSFGLNEATLEPRPDSESLIEAVLKRIRHGTEHSPSPLMGEGRDGGDLNTKTTGLLGLPIAPIPQITPTLTLPHQRERESSITTIINQNYKILDLGTGTGCLLLSLLHELPNATGIGIDIASRAVEQATQNALMLGLKDRAQFRLGNWLENITEKFDIIISNPPYIPATDIPTLMPDVRDYDPACALNGGDDGLDPYRHIIPQLPRFLNEGGFAVFEIGIGQAQSVSAFFKASEFVIDTHKDLGGVERCISASAT